MKIPCKECLIKPICISKVQQKGGVTFVMCKLLETYLTDAICHIDTNGNHVELSKRLDIARKELRTLGDPHPLFKNPFSVQGQQNE